MKCYLVKEENANSYLSTVESGQSLVNHKTLHLYMEKFIHLLLCFKKELQIQVSF